MTDAPAGSTSPVNPTPTSDAFAAKGATADPSSSAVAPLTQSTIDAVSAIESASGDDPGFLAVNVGDDNKSLLIYRNPKVPLPDTVSSAVVVAAGAVPFTYAASLLTKSQLATLNGLATKLTPQFQAAGIRINGFNQRTADGPFVVRYTGDVPLPSALVTQFNLFGTGLVTFVKAASSPLGRDADTSPFWGSDGIHGTLGGSGNSQESSCTGGFSAYSTTNHSYYMTTAWHCLNQSNPYFFAQSSPNGGVLMGRVNVSDTGVDTSYIELQTANNRASAFLWSGPLSQPNVGKLVSGSRNPIPGETVCVSGATTGTKCTAKIGQPDGDNIQNQYSNQYTPLVQGWDVETKVSTAAVAGSGDSGGPIWGIDVNGNAVAFGAVDANFGLDQINCPTGTTRVDNHGGKATCYTLIFMVGINRMLQGHDLIVYGFN